MSKNIEKKRSIPKGTSTDSLHKYFKPLNEVINQLLVSSVTDRENIDDNETDRSSELSLLVSNSTLLVNNTGNLSLHDDQMPLCTFLENFSTINTNSIASTESRSKRSFFSIT